MTVSPGHASVDPNFRLPVKTTQRTADSRNTTAWGCCLQQLTEVSRVDAGFIDVELGPRVETLCNTRKLSLDRITTLSAGDPNDGADYCAAIYVCTRRICWLARVRPLFTEH